MNDIIGQKSCGCFKQTVVSSLLKVEVAKVIEKRAIDLLVLGFQDDRCDFVHLLGSTTHTLLNQVECDELAVRKD